MRRSFCNTVRALAHRSPQARERLPETGVTLPSGCLDELAQAASRRLDDLELHDAILGEGVVLQEMPGGGVVLYAVDAGYADEIGWFGETVQAWQAIDALDDAGGAPPSRELNPPLEGSANTLLAN